VIVASFKKRETMPKHEQSELLTENRALKTRVLELEIAVATLAAKLNSMQAAQTLQSLLVALESVDSIDVRVVTNNQRLKFKYSSLRTPVPSATTRGWQWARPLGYNNTGQDYDWLVLVGAKDPRFSDQYLDVSEFVFFLVPKADVFALMTPEKKSGGGMITTTTNPARLLSPQRRSLFSKYMVSMARIQEFEPFDFGQR
jgi:hypothetical protein